MKKYKGFIEVLITLMDSDCCTACRFLEDYPNDYHLNHRPLCNLFGEFLNTKNKEYGMGEHATAVERSDKCTKHFVKSEKS